MKRFSSTHLMSIGAGAVLVGLGAYWGAMVVQAQNAPPAAPTPGASPTVTLVPGGPGGPGGGKGGGAGKGKGRGAVDTLGDGAWDLKTEKQNIHVSVVTKGLDHPWGLAFLPNGDMLVTEREGRLRLVHNGVLDPTPLTGIPATRPTANSFGGLMDIELHPKFAQNHWVYFTYSKPGPADDLQHSALAVGRGRYEAGTALLDVKEIFVTDPAFGGTGAPKGCCGQGPADASYGSRLVFDRTGAMVFSSGDRNYGEVAQDPSSDIGKILRITDDGGIPKDNPFVGKQGYKPEIYAIGVRNPLGLTIDSATGQIWESEFGPRGGDEVNRIKAGANYGWIIATHGEHYNMAEHKITMDGGEEPVMHWEPVIDPGNLIIYHGTKFPPWEGALIMGNMTRNVLRATFDAKGNVTGQERFMTELNQRFRDTRLGPDGNIYILTDETFGAVLKIEPGK